MAKSNDWGIVNCTKFEVDFLPGLAPDEDRSDATVVMTDVLRASTTMVTALTYGAATIWPHALIESARLASRETPGSLLCGERSGKKIDGFDCGNSPLEFAPEFVSGKTMIHCTTNGTAALERCRGVARILIGAFVNLKAVVDQLESADRAVVVCAGTDGQITGEDVLFAGAVGYQLLQRCSDLQLSDPAKIAVAHWTSEVERTQRHGELSQILSQCRGGRPLAKLGYEKDIRFCSQLNQFSQVPELDQNRWRIRLA